ncbi:hypothetical protein [Armatimonas sp.]
MKEGLPKKRLADELVVSGTVTKVAKTTIAETIIELLLNEKL